MVDTSLSWLGVYPLALDLTNTILANRSHPIDLLSTGADLDKWVDAVSRRHPVVRGATGHLAEVRDLRRIVRTTLYAQAEKDALPLEAISALNWMSSQSPNYPTIGVDASRGNVDLSPDEYTAFAGAVTRSAIETAAGPTLGVCGAPSCGMLFVVGDPRQRWCSSSCGNRARVARHADRVRVAGA